jgi:two-component system cell cycle response regulator DivK
MTTVRPDSLPRPVVLVVEDEESLRGMLALVLRSRGYEVLLCANGAEARTQIESDARIDAALFDLRMPVVTGTELLASIRSDPRRAATPAIAMSAYSDDLQAHALIAAGADAFLAKPFTVQELSATIDGFLRP